MLYSVTEPIKIDNPIEATAYMTDRPGQLLARFYGYLGLSALCADIPEHANVLDMGSGASDLGHEVSRRRPDIRWTNFDARYGSDEYPDDEKASIARMQATAPHNLTYVGGNVLSLPAQITEQRYHRIFSYYMFPHVLDYCGKSAAFTAMRDTLGLLTPDGLLSTGPNRYRDDAWTAARSDYPSLRSMAADMIQRYTESWKASQKRLQSERSKKYPVHIGYPEV